eukprot:2666472-Pleurochrysis_carterae.AAC.1
MRLGAHVRVVLGDSSCRQSPLVLPSMWHCCLADCYGPVRTALQLQAMKLARAYSCLMLDQDAPLTHHEQLSWHDHERSLGIPGLRTFLFCSTSIISTAAVPD